MTVREIFERAIKIGILSDPRGINGVKKALQRQRREYQELSAREKSEFDTERLSNPYSDSRILCGDQQKQVKRVLAGIDISVGEILLARELEREGKKIDLIIAHHPQGKAYAGLNNVMHLQTDVLSNLGVPINVAESLMQSRIEQVYRSVAPVNTNQPVDAASLLNFPFMCIHTPADNKAYRFMDLAIKRKSPETVGDVVELIRDIPEYQEAIRRGNAPHIVAGGSKNRAGKIVVSEFTGGTNAGKEIYERLSMAGVGTIVSMHMKDEHRDEAKKHYINVVIAPHIASDSLGLNQVLDEIEFRGVEVISCSGLIRVPRARRGRKPAKK